MKTNKDQFLEILTRFFKRYQRLPTKSVHPGRQMRCQFFQDFSESATMEKEQAISKVRRKNLKFFVKFIHKSL